MPDPIETWRDVSARAARGSGYRADEPRRGGSAVGSIAATMVAAAIVIAALALRPAANNGSSGPVTDRAEDTMFRLDLVTPQGTYRPGDPISPVASLTYLGPDGSMRIYHDTRTVQFRIEEVGGLRVMGGGSRLVCAASDLAQGVPLDIPFSKAGSPTDGETIGFDRAWYDDPTLRLPVGTWRIIAGLSVEAGGTEPCRGDLHDLSVENQIRVVADGSPGPAESQAPSASASQPPPSPSPSPLPSPSFSVDPVTGSANDGVFRLELSTPHGIFRPEDAIAPVATLTFLGPAGQITFGYGDPAVSFTIDEIGGDRRMVGGGSEVCSSTTLARGTPSTSRFVKGSESLTGFDQAWLDEPVLRLPPGIWRVSAKLQAYVPDCGLVGIHQLTAENVIKVVDGSTSIPSPVAPADATVALEFVRKFEDGLTTGHADSSWLFLSPWSQASVGSFAEFKRRYAWSTPPAAPLDIGQPSQDPELLSRAFLGDRANDLAANADLTRAFVVPVRSPATDGAAAATANLVVAPLLADETWRVWLDATNGG